jgi:hypothetical protein
MGGAVIGGPVVSSFRAAITFPTFIVGGKLYFVGLPVCKHVCLSHLEDGCCLCSKDRHIRSMCYICSQPPEAQ